MIRNIEAEQAVLGAVFLEPTVIEELKLQSAHFADPRHIKIYKAMSEVATKNEAIDFVKVTSELGEDINDAGGTTYLLDLANSSPSAASSKYYEQLVFDAYKSRTAQHYALKFYEEPGVERLDNFMTSLQQLSEEGIVKQKKTTRDFLLEIAEDMMDPEQTESTG